MRTMKESFWRQYNSLCWSPLSPSPWLHMGFNSKSEADEAEEDNKGDESSLIPSSSFLCEICIETKTEAESFSIRGCNHSYCRDCMVKYVGSKLDDNVINIRCPVPRCGGVLEIDDCREVLPKKVFDRWQNYSLCNAAVMENESERFMYYCPAFWQMLNDSATKSECPKSNRESEISVEFERVIDNEEDRVVMELAAKKMWRRCPYCKFYVEKLNGCHTAQCRCGNYFCYACGRGMGSACLCFNNPINTICRSILRCFLCD